MHWSYVFFALTHRYEAQGGWYRVEFKLEMERALQVLWMKKVAGYPEFTAYDEHNTVTSIHIQ